ncbi:hypothetical protein ACI2L1_18655 [Streptomyces sp. NPDC019531]|uniref:hypothetical protein n=1 Tax=Streptomyces sp. NPDC019531 TaxID=3365062 RepID=UPI003850A2A5
MDQHAGAAAGAATLSGRAMKVSSAVGVAGETVTVMADVDDISVDLIKQAQTDIGRPDPADLPRRPARLRRRHVDDRSQPAVPPHLFARSHA